MEEKNELDALREKLLYKQKQGYDIIDVDERIKLEEYATAYKAYLNAARTEREAVTEAIAQAEALGFVPYERGMVLEPGAKVYKSVRGKALMLAVMGRETLEHGANIAGKWCGIGGIIVGAFLLIVYLAIFAVAALLMVGVLTDVGMFSTFMRF